MMPINQDWKGPQSQEQPWKVGDKVRVNLPGNPFHGSHGEVTLVSFAGRMQQIEVLEENSAWRRQFFPQSLIAAEDVLPFDDHLERDIADGDDKG